MQLSRALALAALVAGLGGATPARGAGTGPFDEQSAGPLFRFFTDSDRIAVRSWMTDYSAALPGRADFSFHYNNEHVTIPAISAPVGSQEAVDAITTASRPIAGNAFQDFVKVRNEFQGGVSRGGAGVDYYLSTESDYLAQQLSARYDRDFMNQQLNLSFGTSYGWDAIDPLADDDTQTGAASKRTIHWNAVATQVVSPTTMVRVGLEYNTVSGLQHNPYRNVYAGGSIVPERHPDHRARRDAFLKLNQYLANRSSLRFSYRLYNDDWGITSHELSSKLSQYVTSGVFARYQYRYYTQTAADFYRDEYPTVNGIDGYRSGDYRTGPLASHLFGVALNFDLGGLIPNSAVLAHTGMRVGYERYFNSNNYSANILETGLEFRF